MICFRNAPCKKKMRFRTWLTESLDDAGGEGRGGRRRDMRHDADLPGGLLLYAYVKHGSLKRGDCEHQTRCDPYCSRL